MSRWQATVANPMDWTDPVVLGLAGGSFSWCLSDTGVANVEVATADLRAAGLLPTRDRLVGRWLSWADGELGPWAGKVTATRSRASGATEVVAKAWDCLLDGRRTPKVADPGMATPGGVLVRAVADRYRAGDPIGLALAVDQQGAAVPAIVRADDLGDLLRSLVRATGWEYRVDHAARRLEFRRRVGSDKSAAVCLVEGREVVDFEAAFDLEAVTNELLGAPAEEPFRRTRTLTVRDDESVNRHGLRQDAEVFTGLPTRAALAGLARTRLARLVGQGHTLQLTLDRTAGTWGRFTEGDSVLAVLPSIGCRLRVRVAVRAYDLERDDLTLGCDVEEGDV